MGSRKLGRPKIKMRTIQVGVLFAEPIHREIGELARREGITRAAWIRRSVFRSLDAMTPHP